MKIIACPNCDARMDVEALEPGSTFVCGGCKNVIVVPGEVIETLAPVDQGPPARSASSRPPPVTRQAPGRAAPPQAGGRAAPVRRAPSSRSAPAPRSAPPPGRGGRAAPPAGRAPAGGRAATGGRRAVSGPAARRAPDPVPTMVPVDGPAPRRGRAGPPPRRSGGGGGNPAIVILAVVGVLVLGAAVFMMMGSDDEPDGPGTPEANGAPDDGGFAGVDPNASSSSGGTKAQKLRRWKQGFAVARSAADLKSLIAIAKEEGFEEQRKLAAEKLLADYPQDSDVASEAGLVKREYRLFGVADDQTDQEEIDIDLLDTYATSGRRELVKMLEAAKAKPGEFWLPAKEAARFDELTAASETHLEKLKTSPRYRAIWSVRLSTQLDAIYKDYAFETNDEYVPYVIFAQAGSGEKSDLSPEEQAKFSAEAEKIVERNGKVLRRLYDTFNTTIVEELRKVEGSDFALPQFDGDEEGKIEVLKVWVFYRHEDFNAYRKKVIGREPPGGLAGYYQPSDQWITLFEEPGEAEKAENRNKVVHEGTHQLMHYYTRYFYAKRRDKPIEDVKWTHGRLSSKSHWFQEGWCELLGSTKWNPEIDNWDLLAVNHYRLNEFRASKRAWPLGELIEIRDRGAMERRSMEMANGREGLAGALQSAFYAHSWAFCHFLWYAQDGKYRPLLVKYLAEELKGNSGYQAFVKIMKPYAPGGDFSRLESEMDAWVAALK